MSSIDLNGYDKSDFASFENENIQVQQWPSLPMEDVVPKADKLINAKHVSCGKNENVTDESLQTIIPSETKEEEKDDDNLYKFVQENLLFVFIVLFLVAIMVHRYYY